MGYSATKDAERSARAYGHELHISPKHSRNIIKALKGLTIPQARQLLEDVVALKRPIPFKMHNDDVSHRRGMGPGAYPQKASRHILAVLKNAENNAEYKGLDTESMVIVHAAAYRGRKIRGFRPRAFGRSSPKNEQTTNIELIVEEKE
ncbi:MAG: 50S ribosomal protein L22 [Candidatus Thermoplasmatota archaeon]|nr:50S ribosomal protein L22 [Candidatus Thermoplasmatota archaeon]MDD5778101.1 50S ribosomal protein L22 [Candidatus Thermoplasmatota archaeon]